ncbi:hypothetical protein [Nostoc sp. ATCC 53789]|uniref:hypothetical protein n=1 Tax=Nostoc sp. ATCC 53789 TaxID=76335 RepID=UPI000DECE852|nr:hypothetical protein [Nostoc sp. ATCC 53789]QHG18480.1 hypothetical protein GJB62_22570 [Nostoc sp. ATCC 53789]RCJ24912.1 hypothetical protein A6V25_22070 [Nostoc sp. ATCC 53789]
MVNLFVMIPTGKCDRTVFKGMGSREINLLVLQVELPPLIPPFQGQGCFIPFQTGFVKMVSEKIVSEGDEKMNF